MEGLPPPTRQDLLTIMSTEHFTLQGARSAAISDANGRTSFFLSTLSAGVVALAFTTQVDARSFVLFALVVLPTILIIGLASFERLLQLGIENIRTVVAINRVRRYYVEIAPELRPHFTLSDRDDQIGVLASLGSTRAAVRPWDLFITNAGLVAIIDAILGGVVAALVTSAAGTGTSTAAGAGIAAGAAILLVLSIYLARTWRSAIRTFGVRFAPERDFEQSHQPGDDTVSVRPPAR